MFADKVIQKFSETDKDKLFYFDADGSNKEELSTIEVAGIKVVEVGQNYFELKYKLEMEWGSEKIFLYHPFAKLEIECKIGNSLLILVYHFFYFF